MDENNNSKDINNNTENEDLKNINTDEIIKEVQTDDIPVSNDGDVSVEEDIPVSNDGDVSVEEDIPVSNDGDISIEEVVTITEDGDVSLEEVVTITEDGDVSLEEVITVATEDITGVVEDLPTSNDSTLETKKSMVPKFIGIGALLLAVILIAVFILNSPQRKIESAYTKTTFSILRSVANFDLPDGYFNTAKKLSGDPYSANIGFDSNATITPSSFGMYFDKLALINDNKNKQISFDLGLSGENHFSVSLSNDAGYLSLGENAYFFNPKTFGSEFVKWAEDNQQYFENDLLDMTGMTETSTLTYDDLMGKIPTEKDFSKDMPKYQKILLKNATYATEKISYLIDDNETAGKKISVVVNSEDIKATLLAIKNDNVSFPIPVEEINSMEYGEWSFHFTIVNGYLYATEYDNGFSVVKISSNSSEPARKFSIENTSDAVNMSLDFENVLPVEEKGMDYKISLNESGTNFANANLLYTPALPEDNLKLKVTLFLMGTAVDIGLNAEAFTEESKAVFNLKDLEFTQQEPLSINMNSVIEKYTDKFEIPVGDSNLFDHSYPSILGYDESSIPDMNLEIPEEIVE